MKHAIIEKPDTFHGGRTTIAVDLLVVARELADHLPGVWTVTKRSDSEHSHNHHKTWWLEMERENDGMRLHFRTDTNYGRSAHISVSMGNYLYATGEMIDARWAHNKTGGAKTSARMTVANTTAKKLAKAIERRVITPAVPVLAIYRELQVESRNRLDAKQAVMAKIERLPGVTKHVWSRDDSYSIGKATIRLSLDGGCRVESFHLGADDVEAFAKFVLSLDK